MINVLSFTKDTVLIILNDDKKYPGNYPYTEDIYTNLRIPIIYIHIHTSILLYIPGYLQLTSVLGSSIYYNNNKVKISPLIKISNLSNVLHRFLCTGV